jgi:hypothetical protein
MNVIGKPVDQQGDIEQPKLSDRQAPSFDQQSTETKMLETGIKVIDLLEPYVRGGKIGLFGGAGGKDGHHHGTDQPDCDASRRFSVLPVWANAPAKGTTCGWK